jgi:GH25 family lysozyme M1 (1,4-beta-N-acetylmuramidase)
MATCRGIDVSAYQGSQDWSAWKKQGVAFAFAKASEGQGTHDPRFATHITAIKAAGLVPGGYHFAWPVQNVVAEADNYIAAAKAHAGKGFTHWLDLERYSDGRNYGGRTAAQIRAWVTTWLAAVEKAFPGQRVGVYTSAGDLANGHVPPGVPLWYPAYPGTAVDTFAEAQAHAQPSPSGWKPLIWQFTSDPAGPGRIDESIAYLSAADLRAWAAGTTPPEDDMTPAQAQQLDELHAMLTCIGSLTQTDPKTGKPVTHGAGYYLAHIHYDALKIVAQEAAQTAAITAMATALGKVDAAIDVPTLVAQVQEAVSQGVTKALDNITIDVNATSAQG